MGQDFISTMSELLPLTSENAWLHVIRARYSLKVKGDPYKEMVRFQI